MIWTTGKSSVETLIADDRAALAAYVNHGGRLILFGTDWAYEQAAAGTDDSRAFIRDTLGIAFDSAAYQSEAGTIALSAASGGGLNLDISEGDVENASLPDVVAPVAGKSRAIFSYPDGHAAAVQLDDRRATAVAFDLLQLSLRKTAGAQLTNLLLEP